MRCPSCKGITTSYVLRTTRPLEEGLNFGDVKQRLRKCHACRKNFDTFEVQESFFRRLSPQTSVLQRQPLLQMESTGNDKIIDKVKDRVKGKAKPKPKPKPKRRRKSST